jgi:LysR family nitrogen assimilation transcriptional regulator
MSKRLDLRLLRYFSAIVATGSFTSAARQLRVAQSALSTHVRELEQRLGVQLLIREPVGVRCTAAGERLLEHARIILAQLARAEQDLLEERASPSGVVSIGVPSGAARVLIAPLLEAARRELPRVTLHIVEAMTGYLQDRLGAGRLELTILYGEPHETGPAEALACEDFYLIGAAADVEGECDIPLAELGTFSLILPGSDHNVRRIIMAAAQQRGCRLKVDLELDSLTSILEWVCAGRARSILTPAAFLSEWRNGKIRARRIVDPEVKRTVVLATSPRASQDAATRAVAQLVRTEVQRLSSSGAWPQRL